MARIEKGSILSPSQANAAQCNVCGQNLNLKPQTATAEGQNPSLAGAFSAEHCGNTYSFVVDNVRADVTPTTLNPDVQARMLAAEKHGSGNPPQELIDDQKAKLTGNIDETGRSKEGSKQQENKTATTTAADQENKGTKPQALKEESPAASAASARSETTTKKSNK